MLSQTGVPEAVDIFLKQLNNPEQTVWVDLWAARGLTNIQQMGRYNLDAARAIRAAKTVADFLEREKEPPLAGAVPGPRGARLVAAGEHAADAERASRKWPARRPNS